MIYALCACEQKVPQPYKAEPVMVPVSAPCNAPAITAPQWNMPQVAATAPANVKLAAILADLDLSKAYIMQLKAELEACS